MRQIVSALSDALHDPTPGLTAPAVAYAAYAEVTRLYITAAQVCIMAKPPCAPSVSTCSFGYGVFSCAF